jgi:hypothetical protein
MALLEVLVHSEIDIADVPVNLRYVEMDAPDGICRRPAESETVGCNRAERLYFGRHR